MVKVWALAKTTLREMLREKVFMIVVVIAGGLLALSFLLGALSFDEQRKILTDFGFLAIQTAMLGISLFLGSYLISKEIEKQTCLLILSRPITRGQFILGKMGGILALNTLVMGALAVLLFALLKLWNNSEQWLSFIQICLSLWFESAVLLGIVIGLSLIVRPVLALAGGIMFFILGHSLEDLTFFANKSQEQTFIDVVKFLHWVSPNFYRMNWKSAYFLENGLPSDGILWMLSHMTGWLLLLILISQFLFKRKDIV
ncbi:ABC transporter permease [Bdellovibrio bacteriovorus]|nr:ABC transporter permease [Bdellovibrio bacteriovorus]